MTRVSRARIAALMIFGMLLGAFAGSWHRHDYATAATVTAAKLSTCSLCAILYQSAGQPGSFASATSLVSVIVGIARLPVVASGWLEGSPQVPRAPPLLSA